MNQLNWIIDYAIKYNQPLLGLLIGSALLAFVGYINWYGTIKDDAIKWIARHIFGDELMSASADGLFMVATSVLVVIGWIWTGLAIMYLTS